MQRGAGSREGYAPGAQKQAPPRSGTKPIVRERGACFVAAEKDHLKRCFSSASSFGSDGLNIDVSGFGKALLGRAYNFGRSSPAPLACKMDPVGTRP